MLSEYRQSGARSGYYRPFLVILRACVRAYAGGGPEVTASLRATSLREHLPCVRSCSLVTGLEAWQDGPQGFFRGYLAFLARDLPFDAIEFVSYEQLRIFYLVRDRVPRKIFCDFTDEHATMACACASVPVCG